MRSRVFDTLVLWLLGSSLSVVWAVHRPCNVIMLCVFSWGQSSSEGLSVPVFSSASSRRLHLPLHRPASGRGLCKSKCLMPFVIMSDESRFFSSALSRRVASSVRFRSWRRVLLPENAKSSLEGDLQKRGNLHDTLIHIQRNISACQTDCHRVCRVRYPELAAVCKDTRTLLLYPGAAADNLEDLASDFATVAHNVILIDGTWSQAKDMFLRNSLFRLPKQVRPTHPSGPVTTSCCCFFHSIRCGNFCSSM